MPTQTHKRPTGPSLDCPFICPWPILSNTTSDRGNGWYQRALSGPGPHRANANRRFRNARLVDGLWLGIFVHVSFLCPVPLLFFGLFGAQKTKPLDTWIARRPWYWVIPLPRLPITYPRKWRPLIYSPIPHQMVWIMRTTIASNNWLLSRNAILVW